MTTLTRPSHKKVIRMNALKTVAHQVEEFGTYMRHDTINGFPVDTYRIDTVTNAIIERDKNNNPKSITFHYGMK